MDDRIDKRQFGFRKARSTAQPMFLYRRMVEIQEEASLEAHTILLDWEKAFDKVHPERMILALWRLGVPDKLVRIIKLLYEKPNFIIKEKGIDSGKRN